ncbi:hypothetical protein PCANB_001260 [Pneumocystis canis]|nr:hypothetical protein PCK1_001281 [Pneumocystis canis]KAG5436985.1 hypothetical protein PCANB_001260 [Pneumocystis canis]
MEKHNTEMNQQKSIKNGLIKRNNISQSRLFNGYSVIPEKTGKNLPLLRSFSSPALSPHDLKEKTISSSITSIKCMPSLSFPPVPSPDILFSKDISSYESSTPQTLIHTNISNEQTTKTPLGFNTQDKPFLKATMSSPNTFHPQTIVSTTSSFPYDLPVTQPIPYNNYGYQNRKTIHKLREKPHNQWLNDLDTTIGSTQNSNITNNFVSADVSMSNDQENSIQENSFHESPTNILKTTNQTEEVIPSAIVVKNIPFQIKKEQLLELFDTLDIPKPYAFNYHFDNGNFRGLAFANFYTPEETNRVILSLNGHDIMGRKLRVEYKRVLPVADREKIGREKKGKKNHYDEQHSLPNSGFIKGKGKFKDIDLNDETTLKIYSRLLLFRNDQSPNAPNELVFHSDLHPQQRRIIHLIAEKLNLEHISYSQNDAKYIIVNRSNSNNIDNTYKNFWNRSNFNLSNQSTNPTPSLVETNLTSIGAPSITNNFFDNSYADSKLWSMKSFNDIRGINTKISSGTYLHSQTQSHNAVINTSFDSRLFNIHDDFNIMMRDLNLNVADKQYKNIQWGGKKGFRNIPIKTNTN